MFTYLHIGKFILIEELNGLRDTPLYLPHLFFRKGKQLPNDQEPKCKYHHKNIINFFLTVSIHGFDSLTPVLATILLYFKIHTYVIILAR